MHLLDVGQEKYGDAVLCEFGKTTVLIDGAHPGNYRRKGRHPSIPEQLDLLLGDRETHEVSLLVVSHAHQDHVGCLPRLVREDALRADAALLVHPDLGFPVGQDAFSDRPDVARRVAAALREEPLPPGTDAATLERFLEDAARLEDDYREMIASLRSAGTRVVQYDGRAQTVRTLEETFRKIGLKVLGPSRAQMRSCADAIEGIVTDALATLSDLADADASADAVALYRRMLGDGADAMADAERNGAAVNLQSIVTRFRHGGRRFLFAGDMQFVSGAPSATVERELEALVAGIAREAPYDFVKLSHHGSSNSFSDEILDGLKGTRYFGICAGEDSTAHPDRIVLGLLDVAPGARWARTDRNGLSTFTYGSSGAPRIDVARGDKSDPEPNSDLTVETALARPGGAPERMLVPPGSLVEVRTRVEGPRTTVTIDVAPSGVALPPPPRIGPPIAAPVLEFGPGRLPGPLPRLRIAGGRRLDLLVVTSRTALAANIGVAEADHALRAIRDAGLQLIDDVPGGAGNPDPIVSRVRDRLRARPRTAGVLLLGGYDVVPSHRVDCIPEDLRARVGPNRDADDFVVWSDDPYGDLDGDRLPELPVSRIPDGRSAALVFAALQADGRSVGIDRVGLRNRLRPFAENVFASGGLLASRPTTFDARPPYDLTADRTYLMLHGDYADGATFRGEEDEYPVAMTVANVPSRSGPVVLAGCCWGALPVDQPAGRVRSAELPNAAKTPDGSIALMYLMRGASAFVGCTGSHYSPEPPGRYYGGPLHAAFWRRIAAADPPALALLRAKEEFGQGMPHGQSTVRSVAIEYKIFRVFTCLGLGW